MGEKKGQHLEFIQSVITRMNANSFQLKGISITIVSVLMAVYASNPKVLFIFIGIPSTILFWFLDSYYLQQERKYRGVYNDVAKLKNNVVVKRYEMPIHKYTKDINKQYSYWNVLFSKTIAWLYLSIIIFLFIIGMVIKFKDCLFK